MTIKDLKNKWNKENNFYKTHEIGSGVHSFIHDFLQSEELFSLKKGLLSTKLESRVKEYIHEKKAKEKRKADFAIYINPDIVIPLEAECYGDIKRGIKQLFKYQRDFDKQYGILTDGFTWRFYNNNIPIKEFDLKQIFEETELFLEFWKEYIKPDFYYLSFFEPPGQLPLLKEEQILLVEQNRQMFFDDITKLIESFKNKLQVEGYFRGLDKKEREKRAVEITYAYIIQFILYKTLVDNDFGKFGKEFEEIVRAIHNCLKIKQYGKILGIIEGISNKISKNIYRPFKKEQKFIAETILNLIRKPKNELRDVSPWLDIFVFIKKYNFANVQNEIFGYIYENYLKELYQEEQKGQYFTDPAVVNFMLKQVGFTPKNLMRRYKNDQNSISLIDPACGSGTFLYSAVNKVIKAFGNHTEEKSKRVEKIVNNNIFGLDIAEFPLYLAEMNILMRMLPMIITEKYNNPVEKKIKIFWTQDSIAEFLFSNLNNTENDQFIRESKSLFEKKFARGELFDISHYKKRVEPKVTSFMRDEKDFDELENSMRPPRRRFDYVIGNPPYVSYNKCLRQKVLVFELMKQDKAKLSDIYGVNLHSIPGKPKKYRPNPNLYAFFIALGIALLKDNGKLCYIIPQTVLVNPDFDVIRYHLARFTTIEKVITFSGKMFVGRGLRQNKPIATSSLIFVIKRKKPAKAHQVEVIHYKNPNDSIEESLQNILKGKNITKKRVLQRKLLNNVVNWNFIKQDRSFLNFYDEYRKNTEDISIYYNHDQAEHQFKSKFFFDGGYSIDEKRTLHKGFPGILNYEVPRLDDKYWTIKFYAGYWPNMRKPKDKMFIKLRQGNQGYSFLDSRYKIIWSYNNTTNFFFTNKPVIWARNKILGIGSDNKNEILYLFALLNSPITKQILTRAVKVEQEETRTILVSLQIIKEQIRVPKITQNNQFIKDEITKRTEEVLTFEEKRLSDFIDFSRVMLQKFDSVVVKGNKLVLKKDSRLIELTIKRNKNLIKKVIEEKFSEGKLALERLRISLSELRDLPIIDFEKQKALKDYIDDLVFALYFNISLDKKDLSKASKIKAKCSKNPHYKTVSIESK